MSLHARKHAIVCSDSNQDAAAAETVDIKFKLQSGGTTAIGTTEYYRDSDETGTETNLEQSAPTPVAVEYAKSIGVAGDDTSIPFFLYWATQGGAASTVTTLDTTGVEEHYWSGPATSPAVRAFSMEDQGDPTVTDDDFNRIVYNVTPTRVSVAGQRRGVVTVAADLQGGWSAGDGTSPTAGAYSRAVLFNFGMAHLVYSTTLGQAAVTNTVFDVVGGLDTDALVTTNSNLAGSPASLTDALVEFNLEATQSLDLQRSYAPGLLDSNNAGVVPKSTDWLYAEAAQQVELELLFVQNDTSGVVEALVDYVTAGTRLALELWLVHPTKVGTTPDSYYGMRASFYQMGPLSWSEEVAEGQKYVRTRWRAQWDATNNVGWHFVCGSSYATAFGG